MITIVKGNILDAKEDIICQQVNCRGMMGSGLAKQIVNKYPEIYAPYKKYSRTTLIADQLGSVFYVKTSDGKIIANLFGQIDYGIDKQYTDYEALNKALQTLRADIISDGSMNYSIAIPYGIGCGLGGGEWLVVSDIIERVFEGLDVTIYEYQI